MDWHATALLCLGRLPEALEELRHLDRRETAYPNGSDGRILTIGAALWLLGRRDEAIDTFVSAVEGIEDGSIDYSDFAGGVSQGLLLWYAGVTARDAAAKERAIRYLCGRAKRAAIKSRPGPLALFVLGRTSRDDVFVQACGTADLEHAMSVAGDDMLKRRQLVNLLFYLATRSREQGTEEECIAQMRRCVSLENPIVELEWFLARGEIERRGDPTEKS